MVVRWELSERFRTIEKSLVPRVRDAFGQHRDCRGKMKYSEIVFGTDV